MRKLLEVLGLSVLPAGQKKSSKKQTVEYEP